MELKEILDLVKLIVTVTCGVLACFQILKTIKLGKLMKSTDRDISILRSDLKVAIYLLLAMI